MNLRTRKRAGALGVALAMAGALLAPAQALAAPAPLSEPKALERGHIDTFYPMLNDDGSIVLSLADDTPPAGAHVPRTPDSVDMVVLGRTAKTFGPSDTYVPEAVRGIPGYHLDSGGGDQFNSIWPGWDTQALRGGQFGNSPSVEFEITSISGPGDVFMWDYQPNGLPKTRSGSFELAAGERIVQATPAHAHTNWFFTAPGDYDIQVVAHVSGEGSTGASAPANYSFVVEPALAVQGLQESYAAGESVVLDAASTPAVRGGSYEWTVDGTVVDGQNGPQLTLDATAALDGAEVSARLIGDAQTEIAAAAPVVLNVEEPAAEQALSIDGLRAHYHQGGTIGLTAVSDPAVSEGRYQWFVQRKDQPAPVEVDGVTGANLSLTAEQAYDDAIVSVNLLDDQGQVVAAAAAVTIDVDDHGHPPHQVVTVEGVSHHYHTGDTANLTASVTPASVLSRYVWEVQRSGESEWTAIAGQNGASASFEVTEELAGAQVRAVLVFDDGTRYVESAPATIEIDDHHGEEPVETALTIEGLRGHYHTGDLAELSAKQDPDTGEDHYHWFIKRAGETEYAVIPGALTAALAYTIAEGDAGAEIIVRLYDHDHHAIAESEPVTIAVDDHHGEEPVETALSIDGLAAEYRAGETATLSAKQDPDTGEDHYHWFVKRSGDEAYTVIPGALSAELAYTIAQEDAGAEIIVRLYDHDHHTIAESAPVVLNVAQAPAETPKPGTRPAAPSDETLDGAPAGGIELDKSTVRAGDTVTVRVGDGDSHAGDWVAAWMLSEPVFLGGDWQLVQRNGEIVVRIPADAQPGAHRIAVLDASGALIGWQPITVEAAGGAGGAGGSGSQAGAGGAGLASTGADLPLTALGGATLLLLAAGGALLLARRRGA